MVKVRLVQATPANLTAVLSKGCWVSSSRVDGLTFRRAVICHRNDSAVYKWISYGCSPCRLPKGCLSRPNLVNWQGCSSRWYGLSGTVSSSKLNKTVSWYKDNWGPQYCPFAYLSLHLYEFHLFSIWCCLKRERKKGWSWVGEWYLSGSGRRNCDQSRLYQQTLSIKKNHKRI